MVQIRQWTDKKALVVTPVKTQRENTKQLYTLALPSKHSDSRFVSSNYHFPFQKAIIFVLFFFLMGFINHICQQYKQHLLTLEVKHLKGCIIFQLERQILIDEISKNPVLTCGSNVIGSPAME